MVSGLSRFGSEANKSDVGGEERARSSRERSCPFGGSSSRELAGVSEARSGDGPPVRRGAGVPPSGAGPNTSSSLGRSFAHTRRELPSEYRYTTTPGTAII